MNKGLLLMGLIILGALTLFVKEYRKDKMKLFIFFPILVLCLIHIVIYSTHVEDAFISFRYAKNFSSGLGLVFNSGERVEGYSNFLWVVTLAFAHWVTSFDIPKLAFVLGLACSILSVSLTFILGKYLSNKKWTVGWGSALLLSSMGCFAAHGAGGLETSLFTVLLLLGLLSTVQDRFVLAGICYSASMMTRPEGVINFTLAVAWLLFCYKDKKLFISSFARITLPVIILILPWTLWRYHYYGYWLPNAMIAKSGGDLVYQLNAGKVYVLTFLYAHLPLVVTLTFSIIFLVASSWFQFSLKTKSGVILIGLNLIAMFSFVVFIGGDWMPAWRYLVPAVPLLCILVSLISFECLKHLDTALAAVGWGLLMGVLAVACCQSSYLYPNMLQRVEWWGQQVNGLAEIGTWFKKLSPVVRESQLFLMEPYPITPCYQQLICLD